MEANKIILFNEKETHSGPQNVDGITIRLGRNCCTLEETRYKDLSSEE